MPDIIMTQIGRSTHHFRALIDVDPANLNPTVDLFNFFDAAGVEKKMIGSILEDPGIEATIEAEFEAQSSSVTKCKFVPDSLKRTFKPGSFSTGKKLVGMEISLDIATVAPIVEQGAIEMKFEFLHTDMR